jgi:hypothetical protein
MLRRHLLRGSVGRLLRLLLLLRMLPLRERRPLAGDF